MFIAIIYMILALSSFYIDEVKGNYSKNLKINLKNKTISVIVPVRNEEKRLATVLESLASQNYSKDFFEVIIVDDRSTDSTYEIAKKFQANNSNFKILKIEKEHSFLSGKQNALHSAILSAKSEIIFNTDAGCTMKNDFLFELNKLFSEDVNVVLCRPICILKNRSFLVKFQGMTDKLIADGFMIPAMLNSPIAGRGAGFAFLRECYLSSGGYPKVGYSLIEDEALIRHFARNKFKIVAGNNLVVRKEPKDSWHEMLIQHRRWARGSLETFNPLFCANSFYYLSSIFFIYKMFFDFKAYIPVKMLAEYIFIRNINRSDERILSLKEEILLSFLSPFYYITVFTYALIPTQIKWK